MKEEFFEDLLSFTTGRLINFCFCPAKKERRVRASLLILMELGTVATAAVVNIALKAFNDKEGMKYVK